MQRTLCLLLQFKLDQPFAIAKPSRVIHFRGIPSDASESEVLQLGQPFGIMTNLVLAKKKNQVMPLTFDISHIGLIRDGIFSVAGPKLWNSLPHSVRCVNSLTSFWFKPKTRLDWNSSISKAYPTVCCGRWIDWSVITQSRCDHSKSIATYLVHGSFVAVH